MTSSQAEARGAPAPAGLIFVVGSSRSGTTMMGRILGRHPDVHTFREQHFFDELTRRPERREPLSSARARRLLSRCLVIERDGYLHQGDPGRFVPEAEEILQRGVALPATAPELFRSFLEYETDRRSARIPCEQTPRNALHLDEIHHEYPDARVVNMVRDPRAVLLSQKKKWRRRKLGGGGVPLREAARAWFNFHPVTTTKLWKTSVEAADAVGEASWLHTVRYEDLVTEPEEVMRAVCAFLGLSFRRDMLAVPQVGSSTTADRPDRRGIDATRVGRWRDGGLSSAEIRICQTLAGGVARRHGYRPIRVGRDPLGLLRAAASLPVKTVGALLANAGRLRNVGSTLRRRLG